MNSPQETSPSVAGKGAKSLRVLCAEDDEPLAMLMELALERGGHRVERVRDGQEAIERLLADLKHFDVLVTDHHMPRLSGRGLVERLRRTGFSGKIVVHCSPLREADAAAYAALGVDHVLAKPVPLDDFLDVIQRLVDLSP